MNRRTTSGRTGGGAAMLFLLPLILGLSGCGFNRESAPAQLFDLGPPPDAVSTSSQAVSLWGSAARSISSAAASHPEPVAVHFSGAQLLADTGVIWRVGDSASPRSYATYRWAAPPLQLVQQRVVERLSRSWAVVRDGADSRAPLLQISLMRFEQVYTPDGKSSVGQVSMQAVLVRDHRVAGSIMLSRSMPAPTQDAPGGVAALRAAIDNVADELATWLKPRLSAWESASPETLASGSSRQQTGNLGSLEH